MAAVTFGWEPLEFVVALSRGGDFVFTLESQINGAATPWPAGIGIELRFSTTTPDEDPTPIVWPATITGTNASWDVPATSVAAVLDAPARYARLRYTEADGSKLVWMRGNVRAS